jgi:hypothetical protein
MAVSWKPGYRVVPILWSIDRLPYHSLDIPEGELLPDEHEFEHDEEPLSREEALECASELNQEALDVWFEGKWHVLFELSEPEECWGAVFRDQGTWREDWTYHRPASLVTPTQQEITKHCLVS